MPASNYSHVKRYVYKEPTARVARSAKVGESVILGKDCIIHDGAAVNRAIIGSNCDIGPGAIVLESHLWDGTRIYYEFDGAT